MSISLIGVGGWATGTTSLSVAYPTGIQAGDQLVLAICNKYPTNSPSLPSGWSAPSNSQGTGGAGANGNDSGNVYATIFVKVATGSESGNLTVTITSGNSAVAQMALYRKAADKNWENVCTNGADNTAGTDWSVTGAANPGITAADRIFTCSAINTDSYSFSSHAISATGVTFGAVQADGSGTNLGQDSYCVITDHEVSAGTASAAPVFTMTASGTASDIPAGATVILRMREVSAGYTLTADSGSFSLTGNAAGLIASRKIIAETGSYVFSGIDAGLLVTRKIQCEAGLFALTGNDAALLAGRVISASTGAFIFTGNDADLIHAPTGNYTLGADTGVFTLVGQNASLKADRLISAGAGAFNVTGIDAALIGGRKINADTGSYLLTGIDASLLANRIMPASNVVYLITGQSAQLLKGYKVVAVSGQFLLNGQAIDLKAARVIVAARGVFILTGNDASLIAEGLELSTEPGQFVFTGHKTILLKETMADRIVRQTEAHKHKYHFH
jgi:MSHA biogenesis protein MshQ